MKQWIPGILSLVLVLLVSCGNKGGIAVEEKIFQKGIQAPKEIFVNTVWLNMLVTDEKKEFDTQVYNVTFEPAGRTFWHSHPGGQILLVTEGKGYYQEKGKPAQVLKTGDVVNIPPHIVHWHGAAPKELFVHIGITAQVHLGPAEWFGPVTDQEYNEATTKL